ncbi:phosphatases II [Metschnikowia bicuspidata]|uniref:Phosphatases II n=1 Tax=Metschnikowia bicuspidata TaxID=27322 RepID=A0A4P9Z857_9ASCO|nr:phosphatases II [Metschnikowia bicuspidata]
MNVQSLVRAVASLPKQMFQAKDGWLDLSYITAHVIVAAGPTDGLLSSLFRSPLARLVAHLDSNYTDDDGRHWHVWNLRAEPQGYVLDASHEGAFSHRPLPDHLPPGLAYLDRVVSEILDYLRADPRNVTLIHCKEGKGRLGTICCALLMYEARRRGTVMLVEDAIQTFTCRRMRRFYGAGVSTQCQVRYLRYYDALLRMAPSVRRRYDALLHAASAASMGGARTCITKLVVVHPHPLLALHRVRLSTYVDTTGGLAEKELTEHRACIADTMVSAMEIALNIDSLPALKDLKVQFDGPFSLAYTWFNLYFESELPRTRGGFEGLSGHIKLPWACFDGFWGIPGATLAILFEQVEVHWVWGLETHPSGVLLGA